MRPVVLYLDFDGVLHPDEVYLVRGRPTLYRDGIRLFEWAPLVEDVLQDYSYVRVVLSTSWVRVKSFSYAKAQLPPLLQARVIGATWHSQMWEYKFTALSRFEQIRQDAMRRDVLRWVAIDDDAERWPTEHRHRLILTDSDLGIAGPGKLDELRHRILEWLCF